MPRYDFDLLTIGAGSGGVASSRRAGSYGARVAICEELRVGGTCVLRGCVPKKLLVYGAQFADAFADAEGFGWTVPPADFDWPRLIAAKDKEIGRLSQIYINMLNNSGVEIIDGRGVVVDPHTVEVAGKHYTAENILIAIGGVAGDARDPRHRTCDLVERGARPARPCPTHRYRRRRLYRGRVRRHLQRLRQRGRRDHPAPQMCSAGSTTTSACIWVRRCGGAAIDIRSNAQVARIDKAAGGYVVTTTAGRQDRHRHRHVCDRPQAEHQGLGLAEIGVELTRQRRDYRRRMAALTKGAEHLRDRRCDRPDQPDPGGDRRGPRDRRDALQRQPDQDGPCRRAVGGVQQPPVVRGRADRGRKRAGNTARSISTRPVFGR